MFYQCRLLSTLLVLISVGCFSQPTDNPQLSSVRGVITVDGTPQSQLFVVFEPEEGRQSVATTDVEGRYELVFAGNTKGAIPGKHQVRITAAEVDADLQSGTGANIRIPAQYNTKSSLTANVAPGRNTINFDIQSK